MLRWKQTKPVGSKKTKKSFTWSLQTFTLRDILNRFKLPCVVKCCYESCPIQWSSFNIDLSQPLLIHSNRTVGKLVGKCVRNEHASLADTGSDATVVIPVDYDGMFYFMKTHNDRPMCHHNVSTMATSSAERFYAASSINCLAVNDLDTTRTLRNGNVSSGETLHRKTKIDEKQLRKQFHAKSLHEEDAGANYLIFKDEKEDDIVIGLSTKCKFYEVYRDSDDDSAVVRPISDVMKRREAFPITIRHVIGELPTITSGYTGIIKCLDIVAEETVLACTLASKVSMELQVDSQFRFQMALNDKEIKESHDFSSAFKICEIDGPSYLAGIKLAFNVTPSYNLTPLSSLNGSEISLQKIDISDDNISTQDDLNIQRNSPDAFQTDDDIPSCYDTGSDVEEEDAQSEFSFKWSPEESNTQKLKPKPRVFNSSILGLNSPSASKDKDIHVWNTEPDVV